MTEMKEFIDALYKMFQTAIHKTFRDILPEYRGKTTNMVLEKQFKSCSKMLRKKRCSISTISN